MKVKQLLKNKAVKASGLLALSLFAFTGHAQTNITVDANAEWIGSMNTYENDNAQGYLWSSAWGFDDLKAEKNTTDNTITLYPNYGAYNAADAYWANGAAGNKILEALPHVDANNLLGQNVTFSGEVTSFTISSAYTVKAYMKVANIVGDTYTPIAEMTMPLTATGNFTLNWNTAQYVGTANHFEYGFIVRGINANPTTMATNGKVVITADEPSENPTDGTTVSIDTTTDIIGYANWFQLDGTTYIGGNSYGIADLKTVVNTEEDYIDLHPNFLAYGDGTNAEWANGAIGTRVFEGNTYVDDETLIGQTVTFEGHCISNTLAEGYEGIAFIKVLDGGYQLVNYTHVPLVGGEDFSITVAPAEYPNGVHFQYGYSVTGINANPTQESALGFARVGQDNTASVADFSKKSVLVYPNPATNVLNIAAQDNINSVQVFNVLGQKVIDATPNQTTATINVSGLGSGVYTVNTTANGKQSSTRFVKQ